MPKSILVGLDGSPFSEAAVELGIDWATRFDCQLTAVGVIDEPAIRGPEGVPVGGGAFKTELDEARLRDCRQQVERFLSRFAVKCADAGVSCKLLEDVGWPHEQILREMQRYDLLLIGQETYFHFETQQTSSDTLQRILQSAPRPVVAVPREHKPGENIVVAYGGSLQAARALQVFLATQLHQLGPVHIVSIADESIQAAKIAERAVEFLGFHGVKASPHPVHDGGSPAAVLMDKAHQLDAGLIVMGCYGRSKLVEFFLGSVTRTLLKESDVPLFLYH